MKGTLHKGYNDSSAIHVSLLLTTYEPPSTLEHHGEVLTCQGRAGFHLSDSMCVASKAGGLPRKKPKADSP